MKKRLLIVASILTALALVFAGCSAKSSRDEAVQSAPQTLYEKSAVEAEMPADAGFGRENGAAYDTDSVSYDEGAPEPAADSPEELSEKIIYNVYASVSVDDVEAAVKSLTDKVKALGGYISYSNSYTSNGYVYANVELRVPAENLSRLEEYTGSIGKVEERTMSTDNITENYYDIKARLEVAEAQEAQYLEILDKAETTEDVLLVMERLDQVRENIESYKGRIRLWDSLVDYSTVTYNIRPVPTLDTEDDSPRLIKLDETWRAMKRGFNNSIIAVANFFSFLLRALAILAIPLVICGGIAVVIIVIVKSAKKHKKEKEQNK